MTLGDGLNNMMSLRDNPIAQAAKNGKVPTLKDVKRSLKVKIRLSFFKLIFAHIVQLIASPQDTHCIHDADGCSA
jgi:hypothetical protein